MQALGSWNGTFVCQKLICFPFLNPMDSPGNCVPGIVKILWLQACIVYMEI